MVRAMRCHHALTMLPILLASCRSPAPTTSTQPPGGGGATAASIADPTLDVLTEGANVHGFTAQSLYLDGADKPIGARFMHVATGFTFDYLRIETAPQGFLWVNSFPTSDMGEPHTQEHLLLGKGDRGRKLGSNEAMALAESSAFTAQWRTAYHFHTVAGHEVFWPVLENHVDALLNPDYTDEEIRREVRNFGVDKGDDGTLRLEEKGTVYNEMVRTFEAPVTNVWRAAGQLVYGAKHPLALDSGGAPDAIREMTPEHIRTFHAAAYHLANMGMIGAFPSSMPLASVLDSTGAILTKLAGRKGPRVTDPGGSGASPKRVVMSEAELPKPAGAAPGAIRIVDYPYASTTNPGPMMFVWPATRDLDQTEHTLLGLFFDAFAGDESTTLYKKLIDSKTRTISLGASDVWSYMSNDQGQPVFVGVSGVRSDALDEESVRNVRAIILGELERISKLPEGDPELVALVERLQSRVIDLRRRLNKFLDTPPGFGVRGTSASWNDHLLELSKVKGFKKSLTFRPELARIEQILAAKGNPFRDRLRAWGLLEAPYGVAARPSPNERTRLDTERKQRVDAELARLQKKYATKDAPSTLARYQQDYDAETKRLEDSQKAVALPPLVATPPMTLDDGLIYKTGEIGPAKTFVATFDSMASARVQLAFDVRDAVAQQDEIYLGALPSLLSDAGVIIDGKPIAADEMRERMRKEILELSVYFTKNSRTGRLELVISGSGNGPAETKQALWWMQHVLLSPDWRVDNIARLRDLIDQQLVSLRQRTLGAEEGWVEDPRDAWWLQSTLFAHTSSFLTRAHDLHRLRWMLSDPGDPKATAAMTKFLAALADAKALTRAQLVELADALEKSTKPKTAKLVRWTDAAAKLPAPALPLARQAGKHLAAALGDVPDDSLAKDWDYLCKQMAKDLQVGAPATLKKLEEVRGRVVQATRARLVEVGSTANQAALAGDVEKLVSALPATPPAEQRKMAPQEKPFMDRLRERDAKAKQPTFVGLVVPSTSSGVFLNMVPNVYYSSTEPEAMLDYLASNLYTGHGAHSIFMKTWAAGLAYSNGLRPRVSEGTLHYYAERCPVLPQTLRFVIDQLKKAKPDPNIARYAIAKAFDSRVAIGFEARASAMAANLVDQVTPEIVRAFRTRVLDAAKNPDLADALFGRMEAVYGRVLPGYGKPDPSAIYFVIGPEKQMTAYQDYLRAAVGKDATLHRLYPRDFWIPATL
jgi:Zn-dependent M16 (insulinase) family peptidase